MSAATDNHLEIRNVTYAPGKRASMRLEPVIWDALDEIARREDAKLDKVLKKAMKGSVSGTRTSCVRLYVLRYFRSLANVQSEFRR